MLRRNYCTAVMLLLSVAVFAQKANIIRLEPSMLDLPGRGFYIDSVIDNRFVRDDLGEVHIGIVSPAAPVNFEKSLTETMRSWFDVTVPEMQGQTGLVAVVNDILVEEEYVKIAGYEGIAIVSIVFCKFDSGVLKVVDETQKELDVKNGYPRGIDLALRSCLKQFHASNWNERDGKQLVLRKPYNRVIDANTPKFRKWKYGVYKNFEQLVADTPDNADRMIIPEWIPGTTDDIRSESTGKRILDVLAVSDGNDLYINTGLYLKGKKSNGWFTKVVVTGRYLAWNDFYDPKAEPEKLNSVGLKGVSMTSTDPNVITLEMKTGKLIPVDAGNITKILSPDPQLLNEYRITGRVDPKTRLAFIQRFNELHPDL